VSVLLFGAGSGTGIGPLSTSTPIVVGVGNLVVATADGPSGILDSLRVLVTQGSQTVVQPAAITLSETVLGDDESTYEARFVAPLTAGEFSISWSGPVLVEGSYFPEQVAQGRSVADLYQRLYEKRIATLRKVVEQGSDDGAADGGTGATEADLDFSTATFVTDAGVVVDPLPMVGWATRW
jgi:hypothetical protein